ncbi:unnamed protein product, partial [Closterium sp. NIES-64]
MEHLHRPTRSHPFLHSSTSRSLFHSPTLLSQLLSLPYSSSCCRCSPEGREGAAAQESGSLTGEGRERAAVQEQSSTQSSEGSEVAAACEGRRTLSCEGRAGAAAREESSQPMAGQSAAALARACLCAADVVLRVYSWRAKLERLQHTLGTPPSSSPSSRFALCSLLCCMQVDVVLRGYSGYNTRWALFLLPKLFPKVRISRETSGKQHVPIPEFKENLRVIVTHR